MTQLQRTDRNVIPYGSSSAERLPESPKGLRSFIYDKATQMPGLLI